MYANVESLHKEDFFAEDQVKIHKKMTQCDYFFLIYLGIFKQYADMVGQ